MKRIILLALLTLAACAGCEPPGPPAPPPPPPRHFGLPTCDMYFPRTQQLADADAAHINIVCEQRPSWAPATATGTYRSDVRTIFIWDNQNGPHAVKILGHELGHAFSEEHPDWVPQWMALRGITDGHAANEDEAEAWPYCALPHPLERWQFYPEYPFDSPPSSYPTSSQCDTIRHWYANR